MKNHPAMRGSTLIEVLVALLVACVGLLGMARLSAASIGHQKSAQLRLTGLTLANQYAERARLNVYGFDLDHYSIKLDDLSPEDPQLDADADDLTAAAAVARADRSDFLTAVAAVLPEGRARVVSRPSATARDLDIWLLWRDTPVDAANSLGTAGGHQCPQSDFDDAARNGAQCMHFRVGL